MKTSHFLFAASLLFASACGYGQQPQEQNKVSTNEAVVVMELFTSEGCSSCPAADALLPELQALYGDKLVALSFHVDYWDRLGWKDAFSKPEWTHRQNQYAAALGSDNIYTPQAVVNGSVHITGSDRRGLQKLLDDARQPGTPIELTAKGKGTQNIRAQYKVPLQKGTVLQLALVQRQATTQVRRGENGGRRLEHHNVVRDFRTLSQESGTELFLLPDGLPATAFHVIAFVQRQGDMHISGAKEVAVE